MTGFVILAALFACGATALVAIPLLKRMPAAPGPAPWAALGAAGVLVVGSAIMYVAWSNWSWRAPIAADSPQTMVARLARKLERDPQDLNGWLMLGRSYTVLGQYPLAARAFRRADQLSGGKSAEALVGEAEVLALGDETELDRRAGRLVERALVLDPNSGKALFFGAASAMRRGELLLARDRFAKLLAMEPPENVRPLLQKQIAAIDQRLAAGDGAPTGGGGIGPGGSAALASGGPAGGARANISDDDRARAMASTDAGAKVRINVVLSPSLSRSAPEASPLFVFVRDPQRPGPPLAVKRLQSHFPQTVELSAADSMMPGRAIASGEKVQVVARIARSGNPVGASGDPFGEVGYLVGRDGLLNIVIDRITP